MRTESIRLTKQSGVATITLNRPEKRNAMHGEMVSALIEALRVTTADVTVRVLVIQGAGPHFCAGADIQWMQTMAAAGEKENLADATALASLMLMLANYPKPTIVLAQGATMGGGLGLLAACDIAVAAENARFAFSEIKIGVVPAVISPYVIGAMGERAARYYFLTGETFDAIRAAQLGLVHQVVKAEELVSVGETLAHSLTQYGQETTCCMKELIQRVSGEKMSSSLMKMTAECLATIRKTPEARAGLRAFLEKK